MAGNMMIVALDEVQEPAWDAFVAEHPEGGWFHRAGWRRVVTRAYGHRTPYLLARRGSEVRGILPLVHVRSPLFGQALISTGFGVHGGILAADTEAAVRLAEEATHLGERLGVAYVELRGGPNAPGWQARSDLYATFERELPADEAQNLKAIPRKKRADVRKSLTTGLSVETGCAVDLFWRIYAESVRNLGTPVFSQHFARAILSEFPNDVELSVVRQGEQPLAALMSFYFKDRVLPYYGGAVPAARPVHAYDLLYWSQMRRAVARGARTFDFGRSKVGTGAYDYKRFWGFEPRPLEYHFRLVRASALPNMSPLNPKYRTLVAVWQRLPLWFANRVGPAVAHGLG
jgi:FemAB-related protein (PEP-CTERM system-associated)